jgi:hypothetical protein
MDMRKPTVYQGAAGSIEGFAADKKGDIGRGSAYVQDNRIQGFPA